MLSLLVSALEIFQILVLVHVVLSWVRLAFPRAWIPYVSDVIESLLAQIRAKIPSQFAGIDISPILLIFALSFLQQILLALASRF